MPGAITALEPVEAPQLSNDKIESCPYITVSQTVDININFAQRNIEGSSEINLLLLDNTVQEIDVDARQCDIDLSKVTVNGKPAQASYSDPDALLRVPEDYHWGAEQYHLQRARMEPLLRRSETILPMTERLSYGCQPALGSLKIKIPRGARYDRPLNPYKPQDGELTKDDKSDLTIFVPFKITHPRDGFHFVGVTMPDERYPHVYTRHLIEPGMTCSIFPCLDDPTSVAGWKLRVTIPRTLGDALEQPLATQGAIHDDSVRRRRPIAEEDKLLEMTVVCSGILQDETIDEHDPTKKVMTFEIKTENEVAARFVGFAAGPFEHVDLFSAFRTEEEEEAAAGAGLRIHGYCLPRRSDILHNVGFGLTQCADHMMRNFGRFQHWQHGMKLCFVDDLVPDTTPLMSMALCSNRLLFDEETIDPEQDVLRELAHCIAFQWAGITLMPDTPHDAWVVTGIRHFITETALKHVTGKNPHRYRMKSMMDRLVEEDVDRPSLHDLGPLLQLGSYQADFMDLKSSLVLYILDNRLCKVDRSKGLIRVLTRIFNKIMIMTVENKEPLPFRAISSDEFRNRCDKTPAMKLDVFWKQWVHGCGCPKFEVYQKFVKKRLCVEMTVKQVHSPVLWEERRIKDGWSLEAHEPGLDKKAFWGKLREHEQGVQPKPVPTMFTGPMTIRIHEADGTPYEHIVEIAQDASQAESKFEIPYNTKYKRIKRNRRQRERLAQQASYAGGGDNADERQIYMLGDVLSTEEEVKSWDMGEFTQEEEAKMDGESYEWLRADVDAEWITKIRYNIPYYMLISQLQQDRDVGAQQDSLIYLGTQKPHKLMATFLTRTVMDRRYYYELRTFAARALLKHATPDTQYVGYRHLIRAFRELFCYKESQQPKSNDFEDRKEYRVQMAIPEAISRFRDASGKCPADACRFLMDLLKLNDNEGNAFSDVYYIASLVRCIATSLIPGNPDQLVAKDYQEPDFRYMDVPQRTEYLERKDLVRVGLELINRHGRRDEWLNSHQNVLSLASIDAHHRMMKTGVVKKSCVQFLQYLQERSSDKVKIRCFEALIDLGFFMDPLINDLFFTFYCTHQSPYLRENLFRVLCLGLAGIATGEHEIQRDTDQDVEMANVSAIDNSAHDLEEGGVVVDVAGKQFADKMRLRSERTQSIEGALKALKMETKGNKMLKTQLWRAVNSQNLGLFEKRNLLDLCSHLFDLDYSLIVDLQYPRYFMAVREPRLRRPGIAPGGKSLIMTFKRSNKFRTKLAKKKDDAASSSPAGSAAVAPVAPPPLNRRISLQIKTTKGTSAILQTPVATAPHPPRPPKPAEEPVRLTPLRPSNPMPHESLLAVQPPPAPASTVPPPAVGPDATTPNIVGVAKQPKPAAASKPSLPKPVLKMSTSKPQTNGQKPSASSKRRKRDGPDNSPRPSKIVKVQFRQFDKIKGLGAAPPNGSLSRASSSKPSPAQPSTPVIGNGSSSKPRKPLPSAAPPSHSDALPPRPPLPQRSSSIIKLKIKNPGSASSPATPKPKD